MDLAWDDHTDVLENMVKAGFTDVFVGIESVDPDVIKKMKKGQNAKMDVVDAMRKIQRAGLEVAGGFIVGSDGEKENVFEELFQFMQEAGIVNTMPGLLTVLAGTDLEKRLEQEGRLFHKDSTGNNQTLGFNFEPDLDKEFLIQGFKGLIGGLYDSKNYYKRALTLMEHRGKYRKQKRLDWEGLKIGARVLYHNVVRRPDPEFLKYMGKVLLQHPGEFGDAIARAVKLHHYQTVSKGLIDAHNYEDYAEKMYNAFEHKVTAKPKVDRQYIYKVGRRILHKAQRQFKKINEDFRYQAVESLRQLQEKISLYQKNLSVVRSLR